MSNEKLKPCPFCPRGGDPEIEGVYISAGWWTAHVLCESCGCQMIRGGDTEQEAKANVVRAWNIRYEHTCHDLGGEEGTNFEYYDFGCSACGLASDVCEPNFCPNCGARVIN